MAHSHTDASATRPSHGIYVTIIYNNETGVFIAGYFSECNLALTSMNAQKERAEDRGGSGSF